MRRDPPDHQIHRNRQQRKSVAALKQRFYEISSARDRPRGELQGHDAADIVHLAFEPYMIDQVLRLDGIRGALEGKLVISVLVGSPMQKLEAAIYHDGPRHEGELPICIKRAMPNLAAELGESMTVLKKVPMSEFHEDITNFIVLQVGKIASVAPDQFDIGGVLARASSAFLSVAFDGILDGAAKQGMRRADARKILTESLFSLGKLLENGEHPAVLREKDSSPRGTTIEGLSHLEEDRARHAFNRATIASAKRSREIGEQNI